MGSYLVFVLGELGGTSLPPTAHPVMAATVKTIANITAESRRERVQSSMIVCFPVVVSCDKQIIDTTVEIWSLDVGGTLGGAMRGDATNVPEATGVAVPIEPWASR